MMMVPGSQVASVRRTMTWPATAVGYSATTSPKVSYWIATVWPASTVSPGATSSSTKPPWVATTGKLLLAMKTPVSRPVRPVGPATMPWCFSTFIVPSTKRSIMSGSRTRGLPSSGVKAGMPAAVSSFIRMPP